MFLSFIYSLKLSFLSLAFSSVSSDLREDSTERKSFSFLKNLFTRAVIYPFGFMRTAPGSITGILFLSCFKFYVDC